MSKLDDLNFTLAITATANLIARKLTDDELELLAALLTQAADTLAAIALLRSQRNERKKTETDP